MPHSQFNLWVPRVRSPQPVSAWVSATNIIKLWYVNFIFPANWTAVDRDSWGWRFQSRTPSGFISKCSGATKGTKTITDLWWHQSDTRIQPRGNKRRKERGEIQVGDAESSSQRSLQSVWIHLWLIWFIDFGLWLLNIVVTAMNQVVNIRDPASCRPLDRKRVGENSWKSMERSKDETYGSSLVETSGTNGCSWEREGRRKSTE